MMALHSIVYVSTAAWPMSEEDLRVLLNASLARNLREHITGVLLYASGHFIQCIEGPTGPLQALFASIQVDQRHRDILLLVDEPIETRDFAAWTMGYAPLEAGSFGQLLTASWPAREADAHPAGRSKGKQLLQIVWGQIASGVAFR